MSTTAAKPLFEENDGQGRVLAVFARDDGKAVVQIEEHGDGFGALTSFVADPLTAPDLCRAICEAAGTLPPVMLGRPDLDAMRSSDGGIRFGDLLLYKTAPGEVAFAVHPAGETVTRFAVLQAAQARTAAAAMAALADEPAGPDPAEVEALAGLLRECSPVLPTAVELARKILLAGWKREAGHA